MKKISGNLIGKCMCAYVGVYGAGTMFVSENVFRNGVPTLGDFPL